MTRRDRWCVGVTAGVCLALSAALGAQGQESDEAVARVGDDVITFGDVEDAWMQNDASSRLRMLQEIYETRRRALDLVIGERLIEREAAARGMTRDALLEQELPSRTLPVNDEEVRLIYERNRQVFGDRTLEQMEAEIRAVIERQRPVQALQQLMRELRAEADDVTVTLPAPRVPIEILDEDPSRGPADAPILMVEFSDFQCPYCQRATNTLEQLVDRYGAQVRFVYKDYPLPNHADAFKAAEAGNCAHDQGMFWELHDRMFENQGALGVPALKTYAEELGLDAAAFATCLDEGRHAGRVQRDLEIGQAFGVSSTPTIFINGRPVMGAAPYESFEAIVEEELAAAGQ